MRILQVITRRQLRGAEIFAFQLSSEFIQLGHQVMIVALQSPVSFPDLEQIEWIDLNLKKSDRFKSLAAWKRFSEIVHSWEPDIIQANASETLKFTVISRWLFGWKTPLVYRNANKVSDFIKSKVSKTWNTWLANRSDFVISVSENSRLDYVKSFQVKESKTVTITIGTIIPDLQGKEETTGGLNFRYFINIASLVPEKNHAGLLSLFKSYLEKGGNMDLVIVGDGKEKGRLSQLSISFGISDRVHFLGYRMDAVSLMKKSEALLLPSLIEGLPGVILEAMANKIPVIAYGVGGIPEVIQNGENGALIEKGNEVEFVNWMNRLETDILLKDKIVAAAFSLCKTEYSIDVIAGRFLKQYSAIIKQNG